jgi:hypothetical protein
MNMMKNIWIPTAALLVAIGLAGCESWTESEPKEIFTGTAENTKSDEYYENLRAYKKSEHSISFGWFAWSGAPSAELNNSFTGLPDSLDLVSLWSGPSGDMTPEMTADIRRTQELKGTKILICTFIQDVGQGFTPFEYSKNNTEAGNTLATQKEYWGWVDGDDVAIKASLKKYAEAIAARINSEGWDGLDIDFEPNVDAYPGSLDQNQTYVTWFLEELSVYLGPKSGTGKMLCIDGEIPHISKTWVPMFDYLIEQAYTIGSGTPSMYLAGYESNKNSRLNTCINNLKDEANGVTAENITNKYVSTENLEYGPTGARGGFYWIFIDATKNTSDNRADGGYTSTAPINEVPSLVGFAMWQPSNGFRKGGFGGYHFESGRPGTPSYKWMRRAIQAQNPAQL